MSIEQWVMRNGRQVIDEPLEHAPRGPLDREAEDEAVARGGREEAGEEREDRQDRGPKSRIYGPRTIDQRSTYQQIYTLRARPNGLTGRVSVVWGGSQNGANIV